MHGAAGYITEVTCVQRVLSVIQNQLELTLVNTLRNLLGPLHCTKPEWQGTPPMDFSRGEYWTDDVVLVDFGMESAELIVE